MNLETKFENLETQLTLQHDAMIASLTDLGAALVMMQASMTSIDESLQWIREAVAPAGELLPSDNRSAMAWSIYRLADAVAPAWPRPTSLCAAPSVSI